MIERHILVEENRDNVLTIRIGLGIAVVGFSAHMFGLDGELLSNIVSARSAGGAGLGPGCPFLVPTALA